MKYFFYYFFDDLRILFKIILKNNYRICFFNENKFTIKYLKHYIIKKRSRKILIFTFENLKKILKILIYIFENKFF